MEMKIFFVVAALCIVGASAMQCLDESGKPVDWWVMLKIPKESSSSSVAVQWGQAYVYLDANDASFVFPDRALNETLNGALGATIRQVDEGSPNTVGVLKYNDQSPDNSKHDSFGHSKGVVGFDTREGFWLIHSVPRFPPTPYTYPDYASKNGQSFLCVSYSLSELNAVGAGFLLNKPHVFEGRVPAAIANDVPNLEAVLSHHWITKPGQIARTEHKSLGGQTFSQFAKNPAWDQRLWVDGIAPSLRSSLYVESWMNGSGGKINSTCDTDYDVYDIREVKAGGVVWTETKDHSKWGVAAESSDGWACIGDINRMSSQMGRGGGAACFQQAGVWKSLHSVIFDSWPCPIQYNDLHSSMNF